MNKQPLKKYFDQASVKRDRWKKRYRYYHQQIQRLMRFLVPPEASVLEVGSGTGDLIASLNPRQGLGLDLSSSMTKVAQGKYPQIRFTSGDVENFSFTDRFDYIILSDTVGFLDDIQQAFSQLLSAAKDRGRMVITFQNYFWEPSLKIAEALGLKMRQPIQNWLNSSDLENMLNLAGWEVIKRGESILCPIYIPLFSFFCNRFLAKLPLTRRLCLVNYLVARPLPQNYLLSASKPSLSIIIPARNEKGNIEQAVRRMPRFPGRLEIIFVEGHSQDNTWEEILRVQKHYSHFNVKVLVQDGKGKGDAVRKGFGAASGDILMILDADLTVRPEELPKFYEAIASGRGEFINGCRLVYTLEKNSMRFLNILGNKFFGLMFSWILGQRLKDTLCGTKVLWKADYQKIEAGRSFFGDFDPFGDFDLLFGAAKLNLKISDLPIRYQERVYGTTNIQRFKHGWLLLKMCFFAMRKIKFI